MDEWKASTGGIVLFLSAPMSSPPVSALDLYRRVWGVEPDKFQKQPNPLMPAVAQGKRGGVMVTCAIQPGRIDLRLTPPPPSRQGIGVPFPLIEDMPQFQTELVRIMEVDTGVISNSVVRVALNLHFLALKPSFEAANIALTAVIPAEYGVKLSDEEDFVFQINRPYMSSKAANVKMNFLTKWSVDRFQILAIPVGGVGATPTTTIQIAATVTLDINSDPQKQTPLSGSQQSSLLREALVTAVRQRKGIGLNFDEL